MKLSDISWHKRYFDPESKQDLQEYKYFVCNKRWKNNCPFFIEWPHLTITDMIRDKLVQRYLDDIIDRVSYPNEMEMTQ